MFLQAYHVQWVKNSCFASMRNAIRRVESHGIIVSQVMHSASPQSDLAKAILKHQPYSPNPLFIARLKRFTGDRQVKSLIPDLIDTYRAQLKKLKGNIVTSHLRTLLNQWCTARRFQNIESDCPFGCGTGESAVEHCAVCPAFQTLFHNHFGHAAFSFTLSDIILFGLPREDDGVCSVEYILLYTHVAYPAFNHCSHGGTLSRRLLIRTLKTTVEHCGHSRQLIATWSAACFPQAVQDHILSRKHYFYQQPTISFCHAT